MNWIDSKAMFCDSATWADSHHAQLESYVHRSVRRITLERELGKNKLNRPSIKCRYGPGLVIYWFGFDSSLPNSDEITVAFAFPSPIHFTGAMSPSQLPMEMASSS